MSKYRFITDVAELMFGSFTTEFPEQFITKRKTSTIHLFKIAGISDDGLTIKSVLDKHTDLVPFTAITKIKNYQTGEVVKAEKFNTATKEALVALFLAKGDEAISLYIQVDGNEIVENQYNEFAIKGSSIYVTDIEGETISAEEILIKEGDITFG